MISMTLETLTRRPTSFIGRETEIDDCVSLLNDPACSLLTLTGPGGVGKTRLAEEVARGVAEAFADGIYFVPLQPLNSVEHVTGEIVKTLPLQLRGETRIEQQLIDYLSNKKMLIILDNLEHLLGFASVIVDILNKSSEVKILITSREPLKIQKEWVRQVAGLSYPSEDDASDNSENYSAIQLFVERVQRLTPAFDLDSEYEDVVRLCQLVEGSPLAIELASNWINTMRCATIVEQVQQEIDLLTTPLHDIQERHRSIRAVFDYSWHLLSDKEQRVMRRLAVFRGGFTSDSAEAISGATLSDLANLVDKSMVKLVSDKRYDMHELLRQYAKERLLSFGEEEVTRLAHATYFANFVECRVEDMKGRRQIPALAEFSLDFENVRTAWQWATEVRNQQFIEQLIDGLWIFCELRNLEHEGTPLFRYAERQIASEQNNGQSQLWGKLMVRAAGTDPTSKEREIALQIARQNNDSFEIAFCLERIGFVADNQNNREVAQSMLEQSLKLYRQIDDRYRMANVLTTLGRAINQRKGMWDSGFRFSDESLQLRRQIGDKLGTAWAIGPKAVSELALGDFKKAENLWLERIELGHEIDNMHLVAQSHAYLSHVYLTWGEFERADVSLDEAYTLSTSLGFSNTIGWALTTRGILAIIAGRYEEGMELCQQAKVQPMFLPRGIDLACWGISLAASGLGEHKIATDCLLTARDTMTTVYGLPGMIACLPVFAFLKEKSKPVRVVELLSLAFNHPTQVSTWMKRWEHLSRFQAELKSKLNSDIFEQAWERGSRLNLEHTIDLLFKELNPQKGDIAKSILVEDLTEREFEILNLIDKGLKNREIAERLHRKKATIDWHLRQIYPKLGVNNRTQAIKRARELGILS